MESDEVTLPPGHLPEGLEMRGAAVMVKKEESIDLPIEVWKNEGPDETADAQVWIKTEQHSLEEAHSDMVKSEELDYECTTSDGETMKEEEPDCESSLTTLSEDHAQERVQNYLATHDQDARLAMKAALKDLDIGRTGDELHCPVCEYSTQKKDRIQRHILAKHTEVKPYSCPYCSYCAVERATVRRHMRTVHEKERRFVCSICGHRAAEALNLKHHLMAVHENLKPHSCPHCPYRAVQERWLNHHIRVKHSGERRFPCSFCPHASSQLAHLKTHISAKHTGEKPHLCPFCPYRSVQKSVMKKHIRSKHLPKAPKPKTS